MKPLPALFLAFLIAALAPLLYGQGAGSSLSQQYLQSQYPFFWQLLGRRECQALPAPLSPDELEKSSAAVLDIHVLGTRSTPYNSQLPDNTQLLNYAWAVVEKNWRLAAVDTATAPTSHGNKAIQIQPGDAILLCWKKLKPGLIGGWAIPFATGEKCKIYLQWSEDKRCYSATHWSGKTVIQSPATATGTNHDREAQEADS